MDHPFIETFEGNAARRGIGEDWLRAPVIRMIENWIVGFKRRIPIRHNQQSRPFSAQARHLQVSGIFANVGIVERALGVSIIE